MYPCRKVWLVVGAAALAPQAADAHLAQSGMGPFYDGALHLSESPEDWLAVVALAAWAGLRGPRSGRALLLATPAGWVAGASLALPPSRLAAGTHDLAGPMLTLLAGLACAAMLPVPPAVLALIACVVMLPHGAAQFAALGGDWIAFAGAATLATLAVLLLSGQVSTLRWPPSIIAARVAGSWIAASGILLLGWRLRGS